MYIDVERYAKGARALILLAVASLASATASAADLDTIGVTLLRATTTNLDGAGIRVAQPEASLTTNIPYAFEVGPSAVNQSVSLFTYISAQGTNSTFPNSVGAESSHANQVAGYFYGRPSGVATNVAHVDSYLATHFYNFVIAVTPTPPNIHDAVVNQSFIMDGLSISQQQEVDEEYDNYAARYNTLFVSGPGNAGQVYPPATCYNGIAVGAYGGNSSIGPTLDNGRAKPDMTAPAGYTSFSTPQVAGAAALLMQAGVRGDGGLGNTNAARDIRTVKALLLNGAVKPANWTNSPFSPLDARYGAGVLNAFNSYKQLSHGKHVFTDSDTVPIGDPHPPTGAAGGVSSLSGWDFNTNSSTSTTDGLRHYYFDVTNGLDGAVFTATATLVWNRQENKSDINDLDLFLYDADTSNLVASSTSPVDNVEHLSVPGLPPGRYDLQVVKYGGPLNLPPRVTTSETYALAFEFFSMYLSIAQADTNAEITWPIYPAGFVLESATNINYTILWSTNNPAPIVTNDLNQVLVDPSNGDRFFRLRRP